MIVLGLFPTDLEIVNMIKILDSDDNRKLQYGDVSRFLMSRVGVYYLIDSLDDINYFRSKIL